MIVRYSLLVLISALFILNVQAGENKKPNIIYILADDLGYGDLGCYGQKTIQTPRIDQMASEGMLFTRHYAGNTVCAPSRCSLMTGLHQGHARVRGNKMNTLADNDFTVADLLKKEGYKTAMIGKWGLGESGSTGDPLNCGFDYYFGYLNQIHAHNHFPDYLVRNGEKVKLKNKNIFAKTTYSADTGSVATERVEYSEDLFIAEALRFIDDSKDEPFFLYLSSIIPHANNESHLLNQHGMEIIDAGIYADENWSEAEKCKAAMISKLDADVGLILDYLDEKGLADNTIVMFSSDNGPHKEGGVDPEFFNSSGGLRGIKRDLYEGGIRVPMIVRWTGNITPGSKTDLPSAFWDILPTLADLTGASSEYSSDGISFLPTLMGKNQEQSKHDYLYWEFTETGAEQAVIKDDWKLISFPKQNKYELYKLSDDQGETSDLSKQYPGKVEELCHIMVQAHTQSNEFKLKSEK